MDISTLTEGIRNSRKSIRIFEEAIDKELATIKEYERIIKTLEEQPDLKTVELDGNDYRISE